jgi:hypothetical protein
MIMAALSPEAQTRLDGYLKQIRSALTGRPSIDADEVERDVLGHIDAELSGAPEPISVSRLLEVLDRLGAPQEWVPDDEPAWRRPFSTLSSGQGDWRLAGLTFFLFLFGPLLFMSPRMLWPMPPVLMVGSFIVARVTLALLDERGEAPGPRRWLIYPPLVMWYLVFAVVLFAAPALLVISAANDVPGISDALVRVVQAPLWAAVPAAAAVAIGLWWVIVGLLIALKPAIFRTFFWPFAEGFGRRHALGVAVAGALLAVGSGVIVILLHNARLGIGS